MFGANDKEEKKYEDSYHQTSKTEDTIIGSTIKIEGDLASDGNIIVEGEVVGSLKTEKTLTVGHGAKVGADVRAKEANIAGEVNGNLNVEGQLELSESAKVNGDIKAQVIIIKAGAIFNGKCEMSEGGSFSSSVPEEKKDTDSNEEEEE